MVHRIASLRRATSFVTGVLIGLLIVTPVFAASDVFPESWRSWLLVVFGVALMAALVLFFIGSAEGPRKPKPRVLVRDADDALGYGHA